MQLLSQRQWWSNLSTHLLQAPQCFEVSRTCVSHAAQWKLKSDSSNSCYASLAALSLYTVGSVGSDSIALDAIITIAIAIRKYPPPRVHDNSFESCNDTILIP